MPDIPHSIRIENIEELINAKHRCSSISDITDIRIGVAEMGKDMINLSAFFQELSAKIDENAAEQARNWERNWNRLQDLEKSELIRRGASKWEAWILDAAKSVLVAIVVIIAAYLMSGGHIT